MRTVLSALITSDWKRKCKYLLQLLLHHLPLSFDLIAFELKGSRFFLLFYLPNTSLSHAYLLPFSAFINQILLRYLRSQTVKKRVPYIFIYLTSVKICSLVFHRFAWQKNLAYWNWGALCFSVVPNLHSLPLSFLCHAFFLCFTACKYNTKNPKTKAPVRKRDSLI